MSFTVKDPKFDDYAKKFDANYERNFPIAFSPNGNLFAFVSAPGTVTISDINTGKDIAYLTGHTARYTRCFFPVWTVPRRCDLGATVQIWDIQNKSLVMSPTTYEGNRVRLLIPLMKRYGLPTFIGTR